MLIFIRILYITYINLVYILVASYYNVNMKFRTTNFIGKNYYFCEWKHRSVEQYLVEIPNRHISHACIIIDIINVTKN